MRRRTMMPAVCQLLAVLLLLSTPMWIPQASAEGQAAAAAGGLDAGGAVADFEGQLVQEAVDLSSINSESGQQQGEGVLDDAKNLESLLHWAIEHSDADALRQKAEEARRDEIIKDYKERKQRVKELSDIVSQQPTETQLMQDHIATLSDEQASTADKETALAELQVLVEPIDNANDLKVLGGLQPLFALLQGGEAPSLQAGAAYVLGTAASNNEKLAETMISTHPELLPTLLKLAASSSASGEAAANKAMYALARLVGGPAQAAREQFYNTGGLSQLQGLMQASSGASTRVKTRAVNLVSDLIEMTANGDDSSLETWSESAMSAFAASALDVLQQSEALDVKEKALHAMRTLLMRRGPAGGAALAQEGAEAVLRESLTELDLLSESYKDKAEALQQAAAASGSSGDAGAAGAGSGSSSSSGESDEADGGYDDDEADDAETAAGQHQYALYVANLCADVLHHLSVHHDEL